MVSRLGFGGGRGPVAEPRAQIMPLAGKKRRGWNDRWRLRRERTGKGEGRILLPAEMAMQVAVGGGKEIRALCGFLHFAAELLRMGFWLGVCLVANTCNEWVRMETASR